jgi:hypothetical protein
MLNEGSGNQLNALPKLFLTAKKKPDNVLSGL